MASSLATIRAAVQIALGIGTDESVWTDAELNDAIKQALKNLSRAVPREDRFSVATSAGSYTATWTWDSIRILAIEHPVDERPRRFRHFEQFGALLRLLDEPPFDGVSLIAYTHEEHTINGTNSLPEKYDDILVLGAVWKALAAKAAVTSGTVNTGGGDTPESYAAAAKQARLSYLADKPKRVRTRRMYVPQETTARQDSDPGP